jgi:hypothetical protein
MTSDAYAVPTQLPWSAFAGPLERAEDALARLDERLRHHPLAEGWAERAHFADACAALWLEGELVHLEDLVLHDAEMDLRAPTHELTRAHAVLRTRRRNAAADPSWATSQAGHAVLSQSRAERGGGLRAWSRHDRRADRGKDRGECLRR